MKKVLVFIFCFILILSGLNAFTEEQKKLALNQEFALYQRLQLDTVIARMTSNNRVYLSEIHLRDLVPSMSPETAYYYMSFNSSISDLILAQVQKERLDYLYGEQKKKNLLNLIPNALSLSTVAITAMSTRSISRILAVGVSAVSAVGSYLDGLSQLNLDRLQTEWELDDMQEKILSNLGEEMYGYKCQIASNLNIPNSITLSTDDLEKFVAVLQEQNIQYKYFKLKSFDKRLEILPDYWRELAIAAYQNGLYAEAYSYIHNFEEIYFPVIYHDKDYLDLLVVKAACICELYDSSAMVDELFKIADLMLQNIKIDDWENRFYALSLYAEVFRITGDADVLRKMHSECQNILTLLIEDYESSLKSYFNMEYKTEGIAYINEKISEAENALKNATDAYSKAIKDGYDKKEKALIILQNRKDDANAELERLKTEKEQFVSTCDLILPPSPELLCNLMDHYHEISEMLGLAGSDDYNLICDMFIKVISYDYQLFQKYQAYNVNNIRIEPQEADIKYIVSKTGIFSRRKHIDITIPISLLCFSAAGSGRIIDESDVQVGLVIDGNWFKTDSFFYFDYDPSEPEYNLVLDIDCSKSFRIMRAKPEKGEEFRPSICFSILSRSGFFSPFEQEIGKESDIYDAILNTIDFAERK